MLNMSTYLNGRHGVSIITPKPQVFEDDFSEWSTPGSFSFHVEFTLVFKQCYKRNGEKSCATCTPIAGSPQPSFHHFTQHSGAATGAAATVHETEAATNGEVATHITIAGFEEVQLHHWSQTKAASHHKEHHRSSADSHRFETRSFFCRRIVVLSLGSDGFDRITAVILGKKVGISWKTLCLGCCLFCLGGAHVEFSQSRRKGNHFSKSGEIIQEQCLQATRSSSYPTKSSTKIWKIWKWQKKLIQITVRPQNMQENGLKKSLIFNQSTINFLSKNWENVSRCGWFMVEF